MPAAKKKLSRTLILTRESAKYLAAGALSGSSRDDITPVICSSLIEVTGTSVRFCSTDRYRVHTGVVKLEAPAAGQTILIPNAALEWLSKNAAYFGRYLADSNRITITAEESGELTIRISETEDDDAGSISWTGHVTKGNFPPVYQLIEKARASAATEIPARLRLGFITKLQVLARWREEAPLIKFTASDNSQKPGPAYFAFSEGDETYAEAIIQPNLLLR